MNNPLAWTDIVDDRLLKSGFVDGVSLITPQGMCIYSKGCLTGVNESTWSQFTGVFKYATPKHDEDVCQRGFLLSLSDKQPLSFMVYKKTFCSIYATSESNKEGLIACSLPYGTLICVFSSVRHPANAVIVHVENFCDSLRA
ncbi:hypothetical protein LSAT2_011871 [Lamellibrachia satsuma]|nr:hypothetical protein LSAT2_011871 [Lamellibrachia satsuma]